MADIIEVLKRRDDLEHRAWHRMREKIGDDKAMRKVLHMSIRELEEYCKRENMTHE